MERQLTVIFDSRSECKGDNTILLSLNVPIVIATMLMKNMTLYLLIKTTNLCMIVRLVR